MLQSCTLRFSRDGRTAAVVDRSPGNHAGILRLIDVGTGRVGVESPWGDLWASGTSTSLPTQDALIFVGRTPRRGVWDFSHWRAPTTLNGHTKEVWGLAFSPDGQTLVSSSDDRTLKLWDVASGLEQRTLKATVGSLRQSRIRRTESCWLRPAGTGRFDSGTPQAEAQSPRCRSSRSRAYPGFFA